MRNHLYIIRGLPGSGKSTLAKALGFKVVEADQFFTHGGVYTFDATLLREAHEWCIKHTRNCLEYQNVTVANTFSTQRELQPYIDMAKDMKAQITVMDLYDGGYSDEDLAKFNVHHVPLHTIQNMRARWKFGWRY